MSEVNDRPRKKSVLSPTQQALLPGMQKRLLAMRQFLKIVDDLPPEQLGAFLEELTSTTIPAVLAMRTESSSASGVADQEQGPDEIFE